MKNRLIRERYAALKMLASRVLPSKLAINKVSALIATRFEQPYQATELSRKKAIEDHPTPAEWDAPHLPPAIAEARQRAIDELLEQSTPVRKVPAQMRLDAHDLPRVLKRDGGESNVEGLAEIVLLLGSLYVPDAEELKLREGADEGEEPDELPPAAASDAFAPTSTDAD